jgi:hypothetical protein
LKRSDLHIDERTRANYRSWSQYFCHKIGTLIVTDHAVSRSAQPPPPDPVRDWVVVWWPGDIWTSELVDLDIVAEPKQL